MEEAKVAATVPQYKGNSIFRNQPSYRTFNKPSEQVDDVLFTYLNEVDSELLKQELMAPSEIFKTYNRQLIDPRNQEPITCPIIDYSIKRSTDIFPNKDSFSSLSRDQQASCLRVLLAWQNNEIVNKEDFVVWHGTTENRRNEQQLVQKYVYDYVRTQNNLLYASMKPLVTYYKQWYAQQLQQILKLPNHRYVTHSGLPQIQQCKALNIETAAIENVNLINRMGQVRLWQDGGVKQRELDTLRVRLDRYVCADVNRPTIFDFDYDEANESESDIFVLPLESLLMLLSPGVDLPTEMMLNVRQNNNCDYKIYKFLQPLPVRSCGWHTNSHVVMQGYEAYIASPALAQWLQFTNNKNIEVINDKIINENNNHSNINADYKLKPVEEKPNAVGQIKTNIALIQWCLKSDDNTENSFLCYSTMKIPAMRDIAGKETVGCHFFKLETKPNCGCEIMSKYELLSAWLRLKLLQSDVGYCTRISLRDFTIQLEEQLTLNSVEQQLQEHYQIKMPQLLSNLHEFFKLLHNVLPGEYLIRCTAKYKDKFLLCTPTYECPPQSFLLHDLLNVTPSDTNFQADSSNNYLILSSKLCSHMHEEHQLLPCAFPAKNKGVKIKKLQKLLNHSTVAQQRQSKRQKRLLTKRKQQKAAHKIRSRIRKRTAIKKGVEDNKELENIMSF